MGKVYKYDTKKHVVSDYPTRRDVFLDQKDIPVDEVDEILFHQLDMNPAYSRRIYNNDVKGYTLIMTGVLESGERAQVIISEIPLYFDVRIQSEKSKLEIKEIKDILDNNHINIKCIKAYPGIGFQESMNTYIRIYFDNIYTRKKYINIFQERKYDTASDVDIYGIPNEVVNRNEWTLGDWSIVRNYTSEYIDKYDTWVIYITNCDDFIAVSKPLSAEEPKCMTPAAPLFISCGYDIEVNGLSFAIPTPMNINETIFMLCFGIYRSDKHDVIYQGCITDQKYMKNYYLQKNQDWGLDTLQK